jgi:hypothetical protein
VHRPPHGGASTSSWRCIELLEETRGKLDGQCQHQISAIALSVESRAKAYSDDELLARYEKTRTYRSAVGVKAARTRRKNAGDATTASELAEPIETAQA